MADYLSRNPLLESEPCDFEHESERFINYVASSSFPSEICRADVVTAAMADRKLTEVKKLIAQQPKEAPRHWPPLRP